MARHVRSLLSWLHLRLTMTRDPSGTRVSPARFSRLCLVACVCLAAIAATPKKSTAAEHPLVILFGGYGATEADMRLWQQEATKDPVYGKAFDFEGIAYPKDVGSNVMRAVAGAADTIDAVADRVRAMPGRRIVIAGHSSGAALAVSVVTRVSQGDTIKLISLDAGINTALPPAPGFFPITHLECWSAANGDALSFGFRRAQTLCKDRFFVLHTTRCRTAVCLHYSVVNRRAAPELTFKQSRELDNGVSGGYADLAVNLDWLARSK